MYYPITCVDNFYNCPDDVRKFALSLNFEKSDNIPYPGKRTGLLHEINYDFYDMFCKKFMSLFHNFSSEDILWQVDTYFQTIPPNEFLYINEGWIHQDPGVMVGVIYLSPNISLECGTSLFKPKPNYPFAKPINSEHKVDQYLNYDQSKEKFFYDKLKENNGRFDEICRFANVYNRLITFDSLYFHKENKFYHENIEPRLTQFFIVRKVTSSNFPIPTSRRIFI